MEQSPPLARPLLVPSSSENWGCRLGGLMVGDSPCTVGHLFGFLGWAARIPGMGCTAELPESPLCRGLLGSFVVTLRGEWSMTSSGVPPGAREVSSGSPTEAQRSPETHGLYFTNAAFPHSLKNGLWAPWFLCFLCPRVRAQGRGGGSFSLTTSLSWLPT